MKAQTTQNIFIGTFAVLVAGAIYFAAPTTSEAKIQIREVNASTTEEMKKEKRAKVDATCMSTAVETRETALLTAWTGLNTDLTKAFTARTTALVAAWQESSISDQAKATKTAWKAWKDSKLSAQKSFRTERKAAWETFKTTAKAECKVSVPKEEALEKSTSDSIAI